MPEFAEAARIVTDSAIVHLAAIAPPFTGGAVVLFAAVASNVAWLCYAELRRRQSDGLAYRVPAKRDASRRMPRFDEACRPRPGRTQSDVERRLRPLRPTTGEIV